MPTAIAESSMIASSTNNSAIPFSCLRFFGAFILSPHLPPILAGTGNDRRHAIDPTLRVRNGGRDIGRDTDTSQIGAIAGGVTGGEAGIVKELAAVDLETFEGISGRIRDVVAR